MLIFKTAELEARLRPLCECVLKHFWLPNLKLLCFFDDAEVLGLALAPPAGLGDYYCGFHTPVNNDLKRALPALPDYVDELIFDCDTGERTQDNLIYLRGSTCEMTCGAIITFSHELTHFCADGDQIQGLASQQSSV